MENGRGREEKGGREGEEGPPKSALDLPVRGGLAPSLLGGIDAPDDVTLTFDLWW